MRFSKPAFSQVQKDFLDKFIRCLRDDFGGEQLAMANRIGCDRSQISRWSNRENAPPDYVCHLLLKELAGDSFKKAIGRRIKYLREKIFQVSPREFTWTFKLDTVTQLEAIENGEVELPRQCIETLMRDYLVEADYLDYGDKFLFGDIGHSTENILAYLKKGFKLHIVTAPHGSEDRSWLKCKFVLHRPWEKLPRCFKTSTTGSFQSTGGGLSNIEDALLAMMQHAGVPTIIAPPVMFADKVGWEDLLGCSFYRKAVYFGIGTVDEQCRDKLDEILATVRKYFNKHQELKAEKRDGSSRLK